MLHKRLLSMALVAMTFTAGACGDDDDDDNGTGPGDDLTLADLAGSWTISSFSCVSTTNSANTYDFFQEGGIESITLDITEEGSFTYTFTTQGGDQTVTGTFDVDDEGNVTSIEDGNVADDVDVVVSDDGDTITVSAEETDFDFDDDLETPGENATCTQVWNRTS